MTKRMLKGFVVAGLMVAGLAQAAPAAAETLALMRVGRVLAFHTDVHRIWVPSGQTIRLQLDAELSTNVELEVRNAVTGEIVPLERDEIDCEVASFGSPRAGIVEIRVKNRMPISNAYRIIVSW
ncbi:MAG TPA: hypothetical protein VFO19_15520 [Vicinamibacterales bacterium]|nr:hypothetical protein [Vicinamibacterales bacterium]